MIEATTSWAYVGAGLRIQLELAGAGVFAGVLLSGHGAEGVPVPLRQRRRGARTW